MRRILIVDDDAELGEEMADMLQAEGYAAETTTDARTGLAMLRRRRYDIFLVDFRMKELTGLELAREIRKTEPKAAIFLVSGKPGLAALVGPEHAAHGIDGVIEKPFSREQLLEKLAAAEPRGGTGTGS